MVKINKYFKVVFKPKKRLKAMIRRYEYLVEEHNNNPHGNHKENMLGLMF